MLKRNTPGSRAVHVFGYTRRVSIRPFDICYSKNLGLSLLTIVDLRADNAPSKNPIVNNLVSTRTCLLLAIDRTSGPPRAPREITNLNPVTLVYLRNRLGIAL